jgi:hypothetical protein
MTLKRSALPLLLLTATGRPKPEEMKRLNSQPLPTANRRFEFQKRSQLFIRSHDEPVSVATMCVSNEDCSPARIHG